MLIAGTRLDAANADAAAARNKLDRASALLGELVDDDTQRARYEQQIAELRAH